LERQPRGLPSMVLNPQIRELADFRFEDFSLQGYDPYPHITAPVAV
jgi:thymidylate synthase